MTKIKSKLKNLRILLKMSSAERITLYFIVSQFVFIILKSNIVISIFDLKPKFQRIHWLLISNTFLTTNKTSQCSEKTIQHINAICFFSWNSSVSWFLYGIILELLEKYPNAAKADGKWILVKFLKNSDQKSRLLYQKSA